MNNDKYCQNQRETIAALVLDEMTPQAADELKNHIDRCQTCTALYQALATEEETIRSAFDAIAHKSQAVQDSLVEQLGKTPERRISLLLRRVTKSRIAKLAAAAAIVLAISMYGWLSPDGEPPTYFSLIREARAAEAKLFHGDGITHILNEIVVYPSSADDIVDEQETSELQQKLDGLNSFLEYHWLPMCSVKADGRLRFNQLRLPTSDAEAYIIVDESWYDPATGNFARVLKLDEEIFFANSYDGRFVYASETQPDGTTRLVKEQAADDFTPPRNPAGFLGITAGLPSGIQEESIPPIVGIEQGSLADGTPVRIAKAGFTNVYGELVAYRLFRIRKDDSTIAEMEFVIGDLESF
ncbi:MAG: anti-sigma factor family protein [Planctomycetota bacterium]|jgi:hypothetical protein